MHESVLATQVLEFPEDIFEEAALVADSLTGTSNSAAGSLHLAPDSYISSGLVAHAVTQLAAGQGTIKLGQVKVCTLEPHGKVLAVEAEVATASDQLLKHECGCLLVHKMLCLPMECCSSATLL